MIDSKANIEALLTQLVEIDSKLKSGAISSELESENHYLKRLTISVELMDQCFDWETNYCAEHDCIRIRSSDDSAAIDAILDAYNNYLRLLPNVAADVGTKTIGLIDSLQQA